jgi:hypothetical protein
VLNTTENLLHSRDLEMLQISLCGEFNFEFLRKAKLIGEFTGPVDWQIKCTDTNIAINIDVT